MNLNGIDFNILKHLACLLDEQSVSKAAKKAGITQPAMSKSLKKIRELFDDDLLIDNGKGYSLTEKAIALRPMVHEILKSMDKIMNPCVDFNPDIEFATIKIVSSDYGNILYLPLILEKLKKHPNIKLEIYSPQEQDLNRLQDEDIDFYLGIGRIKLLPATLIVKKITDEILLSAVDPNHPISSQPSVEEFISYPHMLISNLNLNTGRINSIYNKGVVDEELDKIGLQRNVNLVVPHFSSAPLLLKNSNFILSAPARIIQYFKPLLDLRTFTPPISQNPQSEFYLAWHKLSLNKRQNAWFKDTIIDKIKF